MVVASLLFLDIFVKTHEDIVFWSSLLASNVFGTHLKFEREKHLIIKYLLLMYFLRILHCIALFIGNTVMVLEVRISTVFIPASNVKDTPRFNLITYISTRAKSV